MRKLKSLTGSMDRATKSVGFDDCRVSLCFFKASKFSKLPGFQITGSHCQQGVLMK